MLKRYWFAYLSAVCISFFVFANVVQISTKSLTTDEILHLPAGYSYLVKGDLRVNPEHPILPKLIAALPWATVGPQSELPPTPWEASNRFYHNNYASDRAIGIDLLFEQPNREFKEYSGRAMMFLISLLFIIFSTRYIKKKVGSVAAAVYLVFSVFNPTYLGHSYLVTTDIALAASAFILIVLFEKYLTKPSTRNILYLGASIGLILLTKHTAMILVFFVTLAFYYYLFVKKLPLKTRHLFGAFAVAYLVILAVYLPSVTKLAPLLSITDIKLISEYTAFSDKIIEIIKVLRYVFIPADYLKGVVMVLIHASIGHTAYLMGEISRTGWWYYFPIAFILKNSIFLLATVFYLIWWRFKAQKVGNKLELLMLWAIVVYFAFAINSKTNLGIRHLMPIYPMLFYLLAVWAQSSWHLLKNRVVLIVCLIGFVISSLTVFPNYLSYYSEIVGANHKGAEHLTDSNVDWGQETKNLAIRQEANNYYPLYLEYFWLDEEGLRAYGVDYIRIDYDDLEKPGYYAIGASSVYANEMFREWLTDGSLVEIINYSLYIFRR